MIKEFVESWERTKNELRKYIETHEQSAYSTYEELVRLLIKFVLDDVDDYDDIHFHTINDGDYQGTLIFIIPLNTYQPEVGDYIYTSVEYGSCSVCDTLKRIQLGNYFSDENTDECELGLPKNQQVDDYMTLLLHLLQRCNRFVSES